MSDKDKYDFYKKGFWLCFYYLLWDTFKAFGLQEKSVDKTDDCNPHFPLVGKEKKPYTFNENQVLGRAGEYISTTYKKHYAQGAIQATEFINANGLGEGFCLGNIIKYVQRYGKKGKSYEARERDLFKIIHYAVILLHELEQTEGKGKF